MRVFIPHPNNKHRIEYDPAEDTLVERHEQAFTLIADNEEEHQAILNLVQQYAHLDVVQELAA